MRKSPCLWEGPHQWAIELWMVIMFKGRENTFRRLPIQTFKVGAKTFRVCLRSQTYAKRLCSNFECLYGESPKSVFSPLEHDDHPELDDSPFCGPEDTSKFQSLIGACQWMISLCHMDIAQAIMSLSRFHHCPRQGHVDHLK